MPVPPEVIVADDVDADDVYRDDDSGPRRWWTVRHPIHRGVYTSFRRRADAEEYKDHLERRWQEAAVITESDTLP